MIPVECSGWITTSMEKATVWGSQVGFPGPVISGIQSVFAHNIPVVSIICAARVIGITLLQSVNAPVPLSLLYKLLEKRKGRSEVLPRLQPSLVKPMQRLYEGA